MEHIARDIREGRFPQKSEAQVGEPYAGMQRDANGLVLKYTDKDLHDTEAATIERCAQVAEEHLKIFGGAAPIIAAAIRKLKDRP